MKNSLARLTFLLAASALAAGCATDQGMGVQQGASVTRFHLGQPIARGEIRVESADPADANSLEFTQLAAPVERELARLGWTVARGNAASEQVAVVRLRQVARPGGRGSSLSIGIGGGGGGRSSGVGVGVGTTIPLGSPNAIVASELSVRIQRRSDATVAWEGRAELEARGGTPLGSASGAADRLAWALFQDFPGESGRTIRTR
jgi:predicted small secreted protein